MERKDENSVNENRTGNMRGQRQTGQSTGGKRVAGQRPAGQSAGGKRVAGQRPAGQSASGNRVAGQRPAGQSASGNRAAGQRPAGQSASGNRVAGQRPAGQSASGSRVAGQRPVNNEKSGSLSSEKGNKVKEAIGKIDFKSKRFVILAVFVALIIVFAILAYKLGYGLFQNDAVAPPPGEMVTVTIPEKAGSGEVADILEYNGLITDKFMFKLRCIIYEAEFNEGTYVLNTSMNTEEMLDLLREKPETTEETETKAENTEETKEVME